MSLATREALRSFRRTPLLSLLSVATIAFSLFTFGLFALVAVNFRGALAGLAERVEVVAFVLRGTPPETITLAAQDIGAFPEVLSVTYVTQEQALQRAQEELVEFREMYRDLATNPLPPSLEVRLHPEYRNATQAQVVAERLRNFPFVEDVRYGQEWVERLDRLRNLAGLIGSVIGIAFAVVAMVIIGVAIRVSVLQRAEEISIMRLVGATNEFIRAPFLLEGAVKGLLGGIGAVLLCWAGFSLFRATAGFDLSALVFFSTSQVGLIIVFGTLIGLLGSLLSVGRHLRHV
ncbi:MAG: permease-like cell division protein FtsX [Gemmatimonadota bacterium]|nr:permease-like cell division protein FtsX [Gemmatimonadota bacterium]